MARGLAFQKHVRGTVGLPDPNLIWLAIIAAAVMLTHYVVLNFLARLVHR
ncbi:MAG TPA: hypothetical protein VFB23_00780 [Candidatus Acidoferrales bacterium]|jgi:hypothetical protein|nr:hypothetical protein [Candidatus Acidoferrales bacterium]